MLFSMRVFVNVVTIRDVATELKVGQTHNWHACTVDLNKKIGRLNIAMHKFVVVQEFDRFHTLQKQIPYLALVRFDVANDIFTEIRHRVLFESIGFNGISSLTLCRYHLLIDRTRRNRLISGRRAEYNVTE